MIYKLAWRNVWRSKRRTIITLSSVAVGIVLTIFSVGLGDYTYEKMINDSATMGFGHVTVQPEGYLDAPSLKRRLVDGDRILETVRQAPGVDRATARIVGQAMFQSARKSVGGGFIAVDPDDEDGEINLLIRNIVEGEMFEGRGGRGALVGRSMADKLGLGIGKKFVLTAIDKDGELVSELLRVKAIFRTGVTEVDLSTVVVPIDRIRGTLRYEPNAVTLVSAYISDYRQSASTRDRLRAEIGGSHEIESWRKTQAELASLSDLDRGMNYLFMSLLGLLIAAGVLNTSLMSVLERRQEFGKMLALGLRPGQLARLVVTEAVFIGLAGVVVGAILTVPLVIYLDQVGLDFSGLMEEDYTAAGVLIDPIMRIRLYVDRTIGILGAILGLTIIASTYPAWTATRVPPVEALKELT